MAPAAAKAASSGISAATRAVAASKRGKKALGHSLKRSATPAVKPKAKAAEAFGKLFRGSARKAKSPRNEVGPPGAEPSGTDSKATQDAVVGVDLNLTATEVAVAEANGKVTPQEVVAVAESHNAEASMILEPPLVSSDQTSRTQHGLPEGMKKRCRKCNVEVDVLDRKVRIFHKKMEAQCHTCGNRQVGLIRLFGTSYLDDFEGLPDKEAQKFWEDMPTGFNAKKLESYIVNLITEQKIHRELDEVKGKFLPLDVWGAKGFNVEDIEKNTTEEDQETHPVLGMTYRVNIRTTSTIHLWERIRMEAHKHVENMKSLRQNNAEDSRDRSRSGGRDRSRSRRKSRSRSRRTTRSDSHSARRPIDESRDPMREKLEKQLEEKLAKERQRISDKEAALKARKEERERESLEKKEKHEKAKAYSSIRSQASRCIPSLAPLRSTLEVHE